MSGVSWTEHAADQSPLVQRSRSRTLRQMKILVEAAKRLVVDKDSRFTTQEVAKEAGMALQTFYRYFSGKDQLLIAVIEDLITEQVRRLEDATRDVADPMERLRRHVTDTVSLIDAGGEVASASRFIASERSRLHRQYPGDLRRATQPFASLIARELRAARDAGLIATTDIDQDAALVARIVMATYHEYAFTEHEESVETITEHLWDFCLRGIGSSRNRSRTTPTG
ncbi:TetR/AcrR family transcriptional regulator [Pseudofrankia sp. EUN1h]|uniref:TetR/AcrR family transcriptional regulator n=1 Tax=Pseudofrankia sp. EUN1h TaxID=1834515 RepID=UPI00030E2011|nr:TetR/AcrR family transcriptional regulator [Pseudofrankia sp. EUN1h]